MSLSFTDFYSHIREYFACEGAESKDFYDFSLVKDIRGKIKFLLGHKSVKSGTKLLEDRNGNLIKKSNTWTTRRSDPPSKKDFLNPKDPVFPQMTKKAEVFVSPTKGRCLRAKETIKIGELIVCEKPFSTTLYSQYLSTHCAKCFQRLPKTGSVPCCNCNQVRDKIR